MGMSTINTNTKVWSNHCDYPFSSTMSNSHSSFDSWAPPFSLPDSPVSILSFHSALFLSIPPYSAFLTATSPHHHLQFPEHLSSHSPILLYWFFLLTPLRSSQFCCTLLFWLPCHHVTICSSPWKNPRYETQCLDVKAVLWNGTSFSYNQNLKRE